EEPDSCSSKSKRATKERKGRKKKETKRRSGRREWGGGVGEKKEQEKKKKKKKKMGITLSCFKNSDEEKGGSRPPTLYQTQNYTPAIKTSVFCSQNS
uniref:Uncharacterized protein n=1 Tax=Mustela putorius furo TaxID=9669 RepID=M3XYN7_MUSPF